MIDDEEYSQIKHTSIHEYRNEYSPYELAFSELWVKENIRRPAINGGAGVLELLISPPSERSKGFLFEMPADVSQRDANVAATIVQWLGTNCGQAFIYQAERLAAQYAKESDKNKIQEEISRRREELRALRSRNEAEEEEWRLQRKELEEIWRQDAQERNRQKAITKEKMDAKAAIIRSERMAHEIAEKNKKHRFLDV